MKKIMMPLVAAMAVASFQRDLAGAPPVMPPPAGEMHATIERIYRASAEIAADAPAESGDEAPLFVDVTFATDTPVRRYDWHNERYFDEVLGMQTAHVRLERLNAGGPVIDSHSTYGGVKQVLGVVVAGSAKIENGKCVARLQISGAPSVADIRFKIREGTLRNISVGYDVYRFVEEVNPRNNDVPVYLAADWEPTEISFVSVPADINSGVRGAADSKPASEKLMTVNLKPIATGQRNQQAPAAGAPTGTPDTPPTPPANPDGDGQRQQQPTPPTPPATPPANPDGVAARERARIVGIQQTQRRLGLSDAWATAQIEGNISLDTANARGFDEWAGNDPNAGRAGAHTAQVGQQRNQTAEYQTAATMGLLVRAGAARFLTPAERELAQGFGHLTFMEMAGDALERGGMSSSQIRQMSPRERAQRALGLNAQRGGAMTTSDFPTLLQSAVNRTLRASYAQAPQTFRQWAAPGTLNDFRPTTRAAMSGLVGDLEKIEEGGEYTVASLKETGESIRLSKFGKKVPVSWESIVNDDLSALSRIPVAIGNKAAILHNKLVYGLLTANPTMADGFQLFSADHGNILTGAALTVATFDAALQLFAAQKDEAGDFISVLPSFLIAGPKMQLSVRQFLSNGYVPTKQGDRNPYADFVTPIIDPLITDNSWTLAAAPGVIYTIEYAFLSGEPELFTEQYWDTDNDSYINKARTVFGTAAIDWRGMVRNPGVV